jgi:CHAT domain-containing protein/Tfp pilus assembly protein PilF
MAYRGEHPPISAERKRQSVYRDLSTGLGLLLLISLMPVTSLSRAFDRQSTPDPIPRLSGDDDDEKDVQVLDPDKSVKRVLSDGQRHVYRIRLSAGQYLKAVVEQYGIDVAVQVLAPGGRQGDQTWEVDSEKGLLGHEELMLVAESMGDYRLSVRPAQKRGASGSYQIRVEDLRVATEQDRALQEARNLDFEYDKQFRAGKYDEALALAERVREIRERILGADHLDVAQSLNGLALIYEMRSEYAKAEQLYERSLAIREKAQGPEHPDFAIVLGNLAQLYVHRGEYAKAESFFERTLAIAEKAMGPEDSRLAGFLNGLAALYYNKTEYAKAEPLYARALAIWEKTLGPEHPNVAIALDNLAVVCEDRGEYAKAEPLYGRALAIREKVLGPEHTDIANSLHNLASFHHRRGEYVTAEPLYLRALAIWEKALGPEHPPVANALNNLAELYADMGEYAKAEPLYERALAIREKVLGPKHAEVALILNNLAGLHRLQGEYAKAEPLFRRALAISEDGLGLENPRVALSFNNLAALCLDRGDYGKAELLFQKALAIWEKAFGPEHPEVAVALNNLANLYCEQSEYAKAEPLLRRTLAIWEKAWGQEHPDVALALNNLANIYCDQGNYEKAEPFYVRALAIREKALRPEHPDLATSLDKLADLYRGRSEYAKAEPLYRRALAIREKVLGPQHHLVAQTLNNLAALYAAKNDPAGAVEFQARANDIGEHNLALNLATGSERQKLAYLALSSAQTEFTLSLHNMHAMDDPHALDLAFTTILRRKGRGLDAMADTIAALRRHAAPEDQRLFDQLTAALSQLAALTFREPAAANLDTYRKRLEPLEEKIESLQSELSARSAEFRKQTQPVTLSAVQAALPADRILIEFVIYTPREPRTGKNKPPRYLSYLLAAQGEPRWVDLGPAEPIDRAIEEWREALSNRRPDVKYLGRKVDERVMRPVRALLGDTSRLLIAPDGSLNLIPFAALVDEHDHYLVERYSISYLTSGRDLLRLHASETGKNPPLVVANPIFGRVPSIVARESENSGEQPAGDQGENGSRPFSFRPLPRTQYEALAIKEILPEASVLLQSQATETALKRIKSPRILHIATHGFFLSDQAAPLAEMRSAFGDDLLRLPERSLNEWATHIKDPLLRSGLALSGANLAKSGDDDGVLTALEAAGLDLRGTYLVVLSACDTGVGEIKNGEGVQGLRRALVLAGSESQVMSLWDVNDAATKELMIQYYRALVRGEERGEGLRQVQLRMLKSKHWHHPSNWAAFIQSGEWASLESK